MNADQIRQFVLDKYVRPAKARGESTVTVVAGDVQKALGLKNRIAWVCTALRADRFQSENHLRLKSETGPPSGMSTTVRFTFEFASEASSAAERNPFWQLRGIAKGVFKVGEWEELIRREREQFLDIQDKFER